MDTHLKSARCQPLLFLLMTGIAGSIANERSSWQYPIGALKSEMPPEAQAEAVMGLIRRLIPERANEFEIVLEPHLEPDGKDTFKLQSDEFKLRITASSGVAAAFGLNYFLKTYCGCHVSWSGDQLDAIPLPLPRLETPVSFTSNDRFRYYQNVCTPSYSMVWWNWTRWEREIDWMALNGINLPLAFTGQESIWRKMYQKLGLTLEDIEAFFTGPAFLAWQRMGNLKGWAGPLSSQWHNEQAKLQHLILDRMRQFGMTPVLPAFAGHVPDSFTKVFPNATVTKLSLWSKFGPDYSGTTFLEPTDPLFAKIGSLFLEEYKAEFGTDHAYNTDLFNEMTPPSSNTSYLRSCGEAVYQSLVTVDPAAVWIMQGWIFVNDPLFWKPEKVEALVTSVPLGRMIILDLQAELFPQYEKLQSYYGQPFIWCMLHNFGGVLGMYGSFDLVNQGTFQARSFLNSTMIGTGVSPEGIEQNDIMYEFMNEIGWKHEPVDINKWTDNYAYRRYGKSHESAAESWHLLKRSVYNATTPIRNHGQYIMVTRPSLNKQPHVWYDAQDVFNAWDAMINASDDTDLSKAVTFRYDLTDVTRQSLQLLTIGTYNDVVVSFAERNLTKLSRAGQAMLDILSDLDTMLATDEQFLLGRFLESAKASGNTSEEKQLNEFNARNQITLWGPTGQILDYATKQWSGIVSSYYYPRWKLFLSDLEHAIQSKTPFSQSDFNKNVFELVEKPFVMSRNLYPTHAIGDTTSIARAMHSKYRRLARRLDVQALKKTRPARRRKQRKNKARKTPKPPTIQMIRQWIKGWQPYI